MRVAKVVQVLLLPIICSCCSRVAMGGGTYGSGLPDDRRPQKEVPGEDASVPVVAVSGQVLTPAGEPITNFELFVEEAEFIHVLSTDSAGRFVLQLSERGPAEIVFHSTRASGVWRYDGAESPVQLKIVVSDRKLIITESK